MRTFLQPQTAAVNESSHSMSASDYSVTLGGAGFRVSVVPLLVFGHLLPTDWAPANDILLRDLGKAFPACPSRSPSGRGAVSLESNKITELVLGPASCVPSVFTMSLSRRPLFLHSAGRTLPVGGVTNSITPGVTMDT